MKNLLNYTPVAVFAAVLTFGSIGAIVTVPHAQAHAAFAITELA